MSAAPPHDPATPLLTSSSSPPAMTTPALVRVGGGNQMVEPLPAAVADLTVVDVLDGSSVSLSSLWSQKRSIVVFLRHWM